MNANDYKKLQRRVYVLEQAVEALLEQDSKYLDRLPAFNDQDFRKELFVACTEHFQIGAIIETGTKWGNTTSYLARTEIPVHSSELVRSSFLIAQERLKHFQHITLWNLDSREMLKKLTSLLRDSSKVYFFYLDAHWYEDLPLLEEIELIAKNWKHFVILIDDFKVPGDSGYGYDDYGEDKALTTKFIDPVLKEQGLEIFYPSTPSSVETGARRGCAVLAKNSWVSEKLQEFRLLTT